jgi:hypothetical protein
MVSCNDPSASLAASPKWPPPTQLCSEISPPLVADEGRAVPISENFFRSFRRGALLRLVYPEGRKVSGRQTFRNGGGDLSTADRAGYGQITGSVGDPVILESEHQ